MAEWAQELVEYTKARLSDREREALWDRGVSDDQIEAFQIGYLNKQLPAGLPPHFMNWCDDGEKMEDLLVFPLTTALGAVRGFQFRHVERERSGYMDYFVDRREPCLFGLHQAVRAIWDRGAVFLVEGVFDLLPVQRSVPHVLATLTANVSPQTVRFLRRIVRQVWIGFDMDAPGRTGCRKFQNDHGSEFEVYVVEYPRINGTFTKDPGDLWEAWGDAQMVPYLQSVLSDPVGFLNRTA